ncbi:MAG: histidine triad nucleotide-binding protein [Syntrophales bacterium]|jgi:histidine triad (HIT) family protein|nr:histidine triad nucleotide-binding protein [Syntrophales bacterium]MDY0043387.1 histidine triad nucleotide-binding protein [Syntrophales bacterium]
MKDCIFCKIINGEIPSDKVYENESAFAFEDIEPMAPVHVIVVPKMHIATLMDFSSENSKAAADLIEAVQEVARIKKVDQPGFRTVINCNKNGGQLIYHLHIHVLGGRKLKDEMG